MKHCSTFSCSSKANKLFTRDSSSFAKTSSSKTIGDFFLIVTSNYYNNEVFSAKTNYADFYIKSSPEKVKIIKNIICPSLSNEPTKKTADVKVIEKTETDELPTKF